MNDGEFLGIIDKLREYLQTEKIFVENTERMKDIERAIDIAVTLFGDADIKIEDDPIQMGALILSIEYFDIVVRGEEIELFNEMVSRADNFEIYPNGKERVSFKILFQRALTRIK